MSQLFRVLKKIPKNSQNKQKTSHVSASKGETSAKVKDENKMKTTAINCIETIDPMIDNDSAEEVLDTDQIEDIDDDLRIQQSVEDLKNFCDQLDEFVEKSQNILNKAYASDVQSILQRRLRKGVTELLTVQHQIRTIVDNIRSVKMQIASVRSNLEEHKTKFNALKAEERRARFFLTHETNKREKNLRNQEKSPVKERESHLPKYYITTTATGGSARSTNTANGGGGGGVRTTFFSIPAINENENPTPMAPRISRNTNRTLSNSVKRIKAIRHKKETAAVSTASAIPIPQTDQNGITIFLRPVSEQAKSESSNSPQSHHSTPSTSIVNFSWFNNQPDQTHSDTATNSMVSASNSLFVFSSSGPFEDLD